MALSPEQSTKVYQLMSELRSIGCAVCVFIPEDVVSLAGDVDREIDEEAAEQLFAEHINTIEERMIIAGNEAIEVLIDDLPA